MVIDLSERRALVCGSTQGIGWAIAEGLARAGADVVLAARDANRLAACASSLQNRFPQVKGHTLAVDFDHPSVVNELIDSYLDQHAGFDILVNNSGGPPGGALIEARLSDFEAAFARLLFSGHVLVQALVPGMRKRQFGRILNVVSTSVYEPLRGLGVSNTTRAAVAGWAKTLSKELAPDAITVNNILPGATATRRLSSLIEKKSSQTGQNVDAVEAHMRAEIPIGRFGQPDEVAALAVFLASPQAAYITGTSIPVDGGRMAKI